MSALSMLAAMNVKPYVPPVQQVVTKTFYSTTVWTPPAGVNSIFGITGKGADGAPPEAVPQTQIITQVTYLDSYGGDIAGVLTWEQVTASANTERNLINGGSNVYWNDFVYQQFSNNKYTYSPTYHTATGVIGGSAVLTFSSGWRTSGPVVGGTGNTYWYASVAFSTWGPTTAGQPTTGFGLYFAGGYGVPASPVSNAPVSVSPGTPYTVSVPPGGYFTFNYYQ